MDPGNEVKELLKPLTQELKRNEEEILCLNETPTELAKLASQCKREVQLKLKHLKEILDGYTLGFEHKIDEMLRNSEMLVEDRRIALESNTDVLRNIVNALTDSPTKENLEFARLRYQSVRFVGMRNSRDWIPDLTLKGTDLFDKLSHHLLPGDLLYLESHQNVAKSFLLKINETTSPTHVSLSIISEETILSRQVLGLNIEIQYIGSDERQNLASYPNYHSHVSDHDIQFDANLKYSGHFLIFAYFHHQQVKNSPSLVHFSDHEEDLAEESEYFSDGLVLDKYRFPLQNRHEVICREESEVNALVELGSSDNDDNFKREPTRVNGDPPEENEDIKNTLEASESSKETNASFKDELVVQVEESTDLGPCLVKKKKIINAILQFRKEESQVKNEENISHPSCQELSPNSEETPFQLPNFKDQNGNLPHLSFVDSELNNQSVCCEDVGSKSLVLESTETSTLSRRLTLSKWETKDCLNDSPVQSVSQR